MSSENTPKRPLSAYILYCNDKREQIKKANPDFKVTQITKELADMWKNISEKDKKHYQSIADEQKQRFQEQKVDSQPEEKKTSRRKKEKTEEKDAPKKPLSGYIVFCSKVRGQVKNDNPSIGPKDITKKLGEMWRGLSDDEKAKYKSSGKTDESKSEEKPVKKVSKRVAKKTKPSKEEEESELEDDE